MGSSHIPTSSLFVENPSSPTTKSTEAHDRGLKWAQYRTIESLQEYVLVSQSDAHIEVYRRQGQDWLFSENSGLDSVFRLNSIGHEIRLSDVYQKVTFEPNP